MNELVSNKVFEILKFIDNTYISSILVVAFNYFKILLTQST